MMRSTTINYVVCVPYNDKAWLDACLTTCKIPSENIFPVDNTDQNKGVAASWNMGIDLMKKRDADWLILLSSSVRFGEPGGMDFINGLDGLVGRLERRVESGLSYHLIAFHEGIFDTVGRFDENFYPCQWEDYDFNIRIERAYGAFRVTKIFCDAKPEAYAHGTNLARGDAQRLINYCRAKWGSEQVPEFSEPFGKYSVKYWPSCTTRSKWND